MSKTKNGTAFAFANHKGGSGKTTAADGFIYSLAEQGYKVLAIDTDPQMNLSYSYNFRRMPQNLHNILMDRQDNVKVESQILKTEYPNIDIIIADTAMATIEIDLSSMFDRARIIAKMLNKIRELNKYDFIVFDTNPSLGLMNYNVLLACDYLIIPVECSAYGVEGISHIFDYYNTVKKDNPKLKIAGVVYSKAQLNLKVTQKIMAELAEDYGNLILDTIINKDEGVSQAQYVKQPIIYFDKGRTRPARQLRAMTLEVLKRVESI